MPFISNHSTKRRLAKLSAVGIILFIRLWSTAYAVGLGGQESNECDSTLYWGFDPTVSCYGQGTYTNLGTSYSYVSGLNQTPSPYVGARAQPGQGQAIDVWGTCRVIGVQGTASFFVPFRTAPEWEAFFSNAESNTAASANNITLFHCARYDPAFLIPSGNALCSPGTVSLPYEATGVQISGKFSMSCTPSCITNSWTNDTQCGAAWNEIVTVVFEAGAAPDYTDPSSKPSGWALSQTTPPVYSGSPPPPACNPNQYTYFSLGKCEGPCNSQGTQSITYQDSCNVKYTTSQSCQTQSCLSTGK